MIDRRQSRNGQSSGARDAWAEDGFGPLPGDTVGLPGGETGLVETVYLCSEPSGDEMTRWSWVVLADGRLLEVAPRGCALYDAPQVLARGTGRFLELVAQDGGLVRFEERVRDGTWQARPVRLTLGRRSDAATLGLGLWATDVILAFGRRLGDSPSAVGLRVIEEKASPEVS
jgi:hypothetical protein